MQKRKVNVFDYANEITSALKGGVLVTSKVGEKVNSMTIGWGHVGRIWETPVFISYVRHSRFTSELLDKNPEFTVNIPLGNENKRALAICGSKSGRDTDKITASKLTLVEPDIITVPAIKEFPLTLECRVVYREEQDSARLSEKFRKRFYSTEKDDHICYYGEIVSAYIIED